MISKKGRGSRLGAGGTIAALVLVGLVVLALPTRALATHAGFDPNNLILDSEFIDADNMSSGEIQRFLVERNSCLKSFSENSRTAAQIISDSAQGNFKSQNLTDFIPTAAIRVDGATKTVSAKVILVTLQKEQSLVDDSSKCSDNILKKALGYGCPDTGGCNSEYASFTKQIEWGAWQLRFNYERAQGRGFSDYQVGQTQTFSNSDGTSTEVTFANRATAALYRYTPHVYNGNHNFNNLYVNTYNFKAREYEAKPVEWSSSDGAFVYPRIVAGAASTNLVIKLKNTGRSSWTQGVVSLGTARSRDRIPSFERESATSAPSGWVSSNRVKMKEAQVAPGETATFDFWLRALADKAPGTYREDFELVADGITWFPELGIYWEVSVLSEGQSYEAKPVEWSSSDGAFVYPRIKRGGAATNLVIKVRNTGKATWKQGLVNLGTDSPQDRIPSFERESATSAPSGWVSSNRVKMKEAQVAPGETATFDFWLRALADKAPGTYREDFELVADGITWFPELGIYWDVKVE